MIRRRWAAPPRVLNDFSHSRRHFVRQDPEERKNVVVGRAAVRGPLDHVLQEASIVIIERAALFVRSSTCQFNHSESAVAVRRPTLRPACAAGRLIDGDSGLRLNNASDDFSA